MADKRDLGIKVSDAIRLNEFSQKLADDLAARPLRPDDEFFGMAWTNAPEHFDWMHRTNAKGLADRIIADAVRKGELELWVRLAEGEASVDHYSFEIFCHGDVAEGAYRRPSDMGHALYRRPLWVKNTDWPIFRDAVIRSRYPEEFAEADKSLAAPDAKASPSKDRAADKLPDLSEAQLQKWWHALTDEQRQLPKEELRMLCRSAFTGHFISRRRIRDLTGPRKRGKKPIRRKPTA